MRKILILLTILTIATMVAAGDRPFRNYPLTDELIAEALEAGVRAKGKMVGLRLVDQMQGLARGLGSFGGRRSDATTGFSVEIHTPFTWITQQASWSAKKYKTMGREDVTEQMLEPVLMVICNPDMPVKVTSRGARGISGVEHVIIRSTKKKGFSYIQPKETESGSELAQNAFGAQLELESLVGYFDMDETLQISAMDKKGEFFVRVIGTTGEEKDFKVKTKHFKKLP